MTKRKNLIYFIIAFSFLFAVFIRKDRIENQRKREITSVTAEWERLGKPVLVKKATREDIRVYSKITVDKTEGDYYQAYVPKVMQEILKSGQLIFLDNKGEESIGEVSQVLDDIDLDTGMFLVRTLLDSKILENQQKAIVYVNTKVIDNVVCLPREIVTFDNGESFVWSVKESRAKKKSVIIGDNDGYGLIVKQGLKQGDLIVFEGYTQLFEGDKLNILK